VSAVRARKLSHALASLALAWVIAGCGRTAHVGGDRTVQLSVTEYQLNPQSLRADGGVLSIIVHNDGRLTHNLVVSSGGDSVAGTKPIPPGQTAELSLNLAPGKYLMASTIQSDQTLGVYGTLIVG
jgi:Cupredoxin-like domain